MPTPPARLLKHLAIVFAALSAATLALSWLGVDLAVTRQVWEPGYKFVYRNTEPWRFLTRYGSYPMYALAVPGGAVAFAALFWKPARRFWREGLFFVLMLSLAHGLLVNSYFKTHWGRPRPHQVVEFGGKWEFREPWQKADNREAKSFPSSHSTAAFFMLSPYFVYKRRDRRKAYLWLAGGILYGMSMGVSRIFNGAHFVTDILWAGGFVYMTGAIIAWGLRLDEPHEGDDPKQME